MGHPETAVSGALVPLGRKYALASGHLEIVYLVSGKKIVLEGPATYEVNSANSGILSLGKATVHAVAGEIAEGKSTRTLKLQVDGGLRVDNGLRWERAINLQTLLSPRRVSRRFTMYTPDGVVVDRVGEFRVAVNGHGASRIHLVRSMVDCTMPTAACRATRSPRQSETWALREAGEHDYIRVLCGMRHRPANVQWLALTIPTVNRPHVAASSAGPQWLGVRPDEMTPVEQGRGRESRRSPG